MFLKSLPINAVVLLDVDVRVLSEAHQLILADVRACGIFNISALLQPGGCEGSLCGAIPRLNKLMPQFRHLVLNIIERPARKKATHVPHTASIP